MQRNYTLSDVAALWTRLTGQPEKEVKFRARTLREAGIFPAASTVATDGNIAKFIVGMLAGDSHVHAAEATLKALDTRPVWDLITEEAQALVNSYPKDYMTFGSCMTLGISMNKRKDNVLRIINVSVSVSPASGTILAISQKEEGASRLQFIPEFVPDSPDGSIPIQLTKSVDGSIIHALAKLASRTVSDLPAGHRMANV